MMLYIRAFHIISMVAWFAGLFYLPRLFVYHATTPTEPFDVMERRLYYGIMWPAAIATTVFGFMLIYFNPTYYLSARWMHLKLGLVVVLWGYHLLCGRYRKQFACQKNRHSPLYYRFFNEIPTVLLVLIVVLVVVKPSWF